MNEALKHTLFQKLLFWICSWPQKELHTEKHVVTGLPNSDVPLFAKELQIKTGRKEPSACFNLHV